MKACAFLAAAVLSSAALVSEAFAPSFSFVPTPSTHASAAARQQHAPLQHLSSQASGRSSPLALSTLSTAPPPRSGAVTRAPTMAIFGGARNRLAAAALAVPSIVISPTVKKVAVAVAAVAAVAVVGSKVVKLLDTPSRPYDREANSVGKEYDAWTEEGVLEEYWGEHVHLGYYTEAERKKGYVWKDFIGAKYDFIVEMMKWGQVDENAAGEKRNPATVLDVGCGVGGTSRYLAKAFGKGTKVTGITLSPKQKARAEELAKEQGVPNAEFRVLDALAMDYPDNSFDLVWACESGEHMPDKKKYVEEMARVLKPGGRMVIATWCQRDEATQPLSDDDKKKLDFLYSEWTHPHFISIEDYGRLMEGTGVLDKVELDDWAKETIPSWRHSIVVGIQRPVGWLKHGPRIWWKCCKDAWCLERMHQAFVADPPLMQYGMMKATKKAGAIRGGQAAVQQLVDKGKAGSDAAAANAAGSAWARDVLKKGEDASKGKAATLDAVKEKDVSTPKAPSLDDVKEGVSSPKAPSLDGLKKGVDGLKKDIPTAKAPSADGLKGVDGLKKDIPTAKAPSADGLKKGVDGLKKDIPTAKAPSADGLKKEVPLADIKEVMTTPKVKVRSPDSLKKEGKDMMAKADQAAKEALEDAKKLAEAQVEKLAQAKAAEKKKGKVAMGPEEKAEMLQKKLDEAARQQLQKRVDEASKVAAEKKAKVEALAKDKADKAAASAQKTVSSFSSAGKKASKKASKTGKEAAAALQKKKDGLQSKKKP